MFRRIVISPTRSRLVIAPCGAHFNPPTQSINRQVISATNEHEYSRIVARDLTANGASTKRFVNIRVHSWLKIFRPVQLILSKDQPIELKRSGLTL
jgi:hypothetical protein